MPLLSGLFEIVTLLIGVALITLLVNPQSNTVKVVEASGGALDQLLRTVTLQNGALGSGYRRP